MKHTKEPWVGMVKGRFNSNHYWHADNDNSSCSTAAPIFAGGEVVCLAVSTDYEMQELEANAQRIVDCVNACSGMENPQAEITSLREQLEIAKKDGKRAAITVTDAFNVLQKYLQDDEDYAWSWHCNIAMNAVDAGAPHLEANAVTAGFMRRCFGIDTQHLKQYKSIVGNAIKAKE